MKKKIGAVMGLYPTPLVVVGTLVDGKVNWILVGHLGIMRHDLIMLSMHKSHYTNDGIKATKKLSVNIVDESLLERADYAGVVSGKKYDKSEVFKWHIGEGGAPILDESPLSMECELYDIYDTDTFDNFICTISNTYVEEEYLNEKGKIDYDVLKPILFEMPNYSYLKTGDVIAKCTTLGKEYKNQLKKD